MEPNNETMSQAEIDGYVEDLAKTDLERMRVLKELLYFGNFDDMSKEDRVIVIQCIKNLKAKMGFGVLRSVNR